MELKPDLSATSFSAQNAFFFAKMSKIAYWPKAEVQGFMQGNDTSNGLGYDRFYWFEVRTKRLEYVVGRARPVPGDRGAGNVLYQTRSKHHAIIHALQILRGWRPCALKGITTEPLLRVTHPVILSSRERLHTMLAT